MVKVAQSCPTLCDPMDYTVRGMLQVRILEWVAFPFSRESSQPKDRTQVSRIEGRLITSWATREAHIDQEATVRIGHGTMDWFEIGKGEGQGCILSPCLFNFYAEYIMRNAALEEAQTGIKIAGRNINNLRYADDTTHITESKEELKSLLMKV